MRKYVILLVMIPVITAVVIYTIVQKAWLMLGIVSVSSIAFLYVFVLVIIKKRRSDVPLYDVFFGAGFVLMMIELRSIILDDITFFLVFCASIMMAVPVFILLWKYFPVQNENTANIHKNKEDLNDNH
ncbi:MAG TPA: hypothetical protein PLR39_08325 [Treponemataceae bacterium]|jgi:hypothetical protein|nr:hypothetical protein [Treponemataceae bacterium]